jgi:hypothetical protein
MTQAELIASLTFISGLVLLLLVNKKSLLQRLGR